MDRTRFFFLFPYADTNYFFNRLRDSTLIYYVSDKYNYINPEEKKFWNDYPRGVQLLHLPREGVRYWLNLPQGKKEQFLEVWEQYCLYGFFPHDSLLYATPWLFEAFGQMVRVASATLTHVLVFPRWIDWGLYKTSLFIIFFLVVFLVVVYLVTK